MNSNIENVKHDCLKYYIIVPIFNNSVITVCVFISRLLFEHGDSLTSLIAFHQIGFYVQLFVCPVSKHVMTVF